MLTEHLLANSLSILFVLALILTQRHSGHIYSFKLHVCKDVHSATNLLVLFIEDVGELQRSQARGEWGTRAALLETPSVHWPGPFCLHPVMHRPSAQPFCTSMSTVTPAFAHASRCEMQELGAGCGEGRCLMFPYGRLTPPSV